MKVREQRVVVEQIIVNLKLNIFGSFIPFELCTREELKKTPSVTLQCDELRVLLDVIWIISVKFRTNMKIK